MYVHNYSNICTTMERIEFHNTQPKTGFCRCHGWATGTASVCTQQCTTSVLDFMRMRTTDSELAR